MSETKQVRMVHWRGEARTHDDFSQVITNEFIDGKMNGSITAWAIFTPKSWQRFGCGRLGMGYGQRYQKQEDGRFMKVEG
jgi:hypothetical protein